MDDSLTRILLSVRCLLWEAHVQVRHDPTTQTSDLAWSTTFQGEEQTKRWLPIHRRESRDFACDFYDSVHPDDRVCIDATAERALREGAERYQQDFRLVLADGRFVWLQEDVRIQSLAEGGWKLAAIITDITEKKTADAAHAQALENAHCILWYAWIEQAPIKSDWDARLAQEQQMPDPGIHFQWDIHLLNEAAARSWLPVAPSQDGRYTTALHMATLSEDRTAGDQLSSQVLREGRDGYTQHRRVATLSGEVRWIREEVSLTKIGERRWYAAGVMVDVTAQKEAEKVLSYQASHDALTGLYNRNHFMGQLVRAEQDAPPASTLLFVDLDNFKPINDRFGHIMGDRVLTHLAQRLQAEIGERGVVSRIGGDEFTIFLPGLAAENDAARLAESLIYTISRPLTVDHQGFVLSASVGIAQGQMDASQDLLGKANTAMLDAKRKGKANYRFFTPEMEEASLQRFEREAQLRRAVQLQVMVPYYQPIVSLKTRQVVGVEALARWPLQEGHFCPPSEFIPLAEETGLIVPLSKALLRRICQDGRRWVNRVPGSLLRVNYNVSERLFQEPGSFLQLRQLLQETRFPASALTLELTESLLLEDCENTRLCLQALHELGIKMVLDDFGTGYSSLAYLSRLPVNAIKIDQSFVRPLASPSSRVVRQNQAIIRAIVALGRALGLEVTAEGIETEKQLAYLRDQGVHYGQGYLFAPPMPADAFESFLTRSLEVPQALAA